MDRIPNLIYAVGDLHGHIDFLADALDWISIDANGRAHRVVFLGDFIDRGPASSIVIQNIITGQENGHPWYAVKGNHDVRLGMFKRNVDAIELQGPTNKHWLDERIGGAETLRSYGIDPTLSHEELAKKVHLIPEAHVEWIDGLPDYLHWGDYFFVHAGVRPYVPLDAQEPMDLRWIRDDFLNYPQFDHGALIVHGHTPVDQIQHRGNQINVDLGAGYGRAIGVAVFEGGKAYALDAKGRRYLEPPTGFGDNGRPLLLLN